MGPHCRKSSKKNDNKKNVWDMFIKKGQLCDISKFAKN